jgi:hypothetical protein
MIPGSVDIEAFGIFGLVFVLCGFEASSATLTDENRTKASENNRRGENLELRDRKWLQSAYRSVRRDYNLSLGTKAFLKALKLWNIRRAWGEKR